MTDQANTDVERASAAARPRSVMCTWWWISLNVVNAVLMSAWVVIKVFDVGGSEATRRAITTTLSIWSGVVFEWLYFACFYRLTRLEENNDS